MYRTGTIVTQPRKLAPHACKIGKILAVPALRYNLAMEQAAGILQRIMAETVAQTLKRLPPGELPQAAWEFAAGQAVAEKTRVLGCEERCDGKTLRVQVVDATWRAQLSAMAPQYVARLRPYLAVERIEFEVAGPQPTSAKRGRIWGTKSSDSLPSQEKGAHEGHRKGRSLRRRPGQS